MMRLQDGRVAHVFRRIRETWLSKKPYDGGGLVGALTIFLIALGSVAAWQNWAGAESWMPASAEKVFDQHQYWRAWTTLFVHGDPGHFLSNSLFMFVLGSLLAGYFGLFVFPIAAFALGGVVNLFILKTYEPQMQLIGASGVVFLMGGLWLTLYMLLYRQKSLQQRILRSIGVAILLFMPSETFDPQVSYRTHALGFAFGVAFAFAYYFAKKRKFLAAEVEEVVIDHVEEEPATFGDFNDGGLPDEKRTQLKFGPAYPVASADAPSRRPDVPGKCDQSCG